MVQHSAHTPLGWGQEDESRKPQGNFKARASLCPLKYPENLAKSLSMGVPVLYQPLEDGNLMPTCLKHALSLLLPQQPHRVGAQPQPELPAGSHRP